LILFYPWCYYATQCTMTREEVYAGTYVRYWTKMSGTINYYPPPLDEARKIIWKILPW
jgi:hypothetical protein